MKQARPVVGDGDIDTQGQSPEFPETRWSVVLGARGALTERSRAAMDRLVRLYWGPVFWYVRRAWDKDAEEAKDLTQEFFARLLEGGGVEGFEADRGRFRAYLCGAVRHYLLQDRRDRARQKRGGGVALFSLEEAREQPAPAEPHETPEQFFHQEWVATLLRAAVAELREEYLLAGRESRFRAFELYDLAEGERPTHDQIASQLGISTHDVNNYLRDVRKRLREKIRAHVRETLADPADLDDEMALLFGPG